MLISSHYLIAIALAFCLPVPVLAQSMSEKVWAVFAYSVHGDSTPRVVYPPKILTAYGANGLHAAGSSFRDRYVTMYSQAPSADRRVQNLSPYSLRPDEVSVLSSADQPAVASAQAFMQGLYPPVETSYGAPYIVSSSPLSNGSYSTYPLHGYQYPRIATLGLSDPRSVAVAGQSECSTHQNLVDEYNGSPEADRIAQTSKAFYAYLYDHLLADTYKPSSVDYTNAREISEYLLYQSIHNASLFRNLDLRDVARSRWLADQYTFSTNGNLSSTGIHADAKIRTIAGRTLASHVLDAFDANLQHFGTQNKMNLVFGSHEPAVALASLMGLASPKTANFYSRPAAGASLVFELFSWESEQYPIYPNSSGLFVRFLLHNGTDSYTKFTPYPLFGHSPSNIAIPLSEFRAGMENFAIGSTKEWCRLCESTAVFCSGVLRSHGRFGTSSMDPPVAGVIGAIVTFSFLAVMAIVGLIACGFRNQRWPKSTSGFKGDSKMASDSDVTFKRPSRGGKITGVQEPTDDQFGRAATEGHSHSGSWEMVRCRESSGPTSVPRLPLLDEDEEWQVPTRLEPVRVRESV